MTVLRVVLAMVLTAIGTRAASTQPRVPVRQLRVIASSDSGTFRSISSVRALQNGGVIVNDASTRQLVVLDASLKRATVIADTSIRPEYSYGLRAKAGALIPYIADSSLFADNESAILLVIDPGGQIVNVIAPVRASDLTYVSSGGYGASGFDPHGRMIYRSVRYFDEGTQLPKLGDKPFVVTWPDSAPILRTDFDLRTVDTIAMLSIPVQKTVLMAQQSGGIKTATAFNPLPVGDEWTLLPDGSVAIVRARDYHIDWLSPDGTMTSSPKMPFDWKPIPPGEKRRMVDSVKRELDAAAARDLEANPPVPGASAQPQLNFTVDATDIPDFYPAVRQGEVRADTQGNVWILPSTSASAKGGLLYDVVNRNGELFERVQLPPGRALVGFGPGNIVYLNKVQSPTSAVLERAEVVPQ